MVKEGRLRRLGRRVGEKLSLQQAGDPKVNARESCMTTGLLPYKIRGQILGVNPNHTFLNYPCDHLLYTKHTNLTLFAPQVVLILIT